MFACDDADARCAGHLLPRQLVGGRQRRQKSLGDGYGVPRIRQILQEDDKLVAAEARRRPGVLSACDAVGPPQRISKPIGDLLQKLISNLVAQTVVHPFEAVEVKKQ